MLQQVMDFSSDQKEFGKFNVFEILGELKTTLN